MVLVYVKNNVADQYHQSICLCFDNLITILSLFTICSCTNDQNDIIFIIFCNWSISSLSNSTGSIVGEVADAAEVVNVSPVKIKSSPERSPSRSSSGTPDSSGKLMEITHTDFILTK